VKTAAAKYRHAAYGKMHCWRAFERYKHWWLRTTLKSTKRVL